MAKKFYIIDGSGYIFRAYYAVQPLSNGDGLPTNALFGFCRMLVKLLKEHSAEHIAVTFDTGAPTFRHKFFTDYKANRSACPEDLVPQMPYFRKIVEVMGIRSLEKEGFEADDIIATLARHFRDMAEEIVVVSGDKDLTQLVDERITVWDAMRDIHYTPEKVEEKFGVAPKQVRDYLALRGDSSDNIPGVKGVGDKTAQALVRHFGSVANLMESPAEIENIDGLRGKASVIKKVESGRDLLEISYELVGLDEQVAPFNEDSNLDAFRWLGPKVEDLQSLFAELEFEKLLKQIPTPDGSVADFQKEETASPEIKKNFQLVGPGDFDQFMEKISNVEEFAFDTETTSLDPSKAELLGISFSWEAGQAYYLPLESKVEPDKALDPALVKEKLGPVFADSGKGKIGQHTKYDIGVLEHNGYEVRGLVFDSLLASHLIEPDSRQHGLKQLTLRYLGEEMASYEQVVGDAESLADIPLSEVSHYACWDAEATWRLYGILEKKLYQDLELETGPGPVGPTPASALTEIEVPLVPVLSRMERAGIKIDRELLLNLKESFGEELSLLEAKVKSEAGEDFNLNSPKQLSSILFEKLGIPTKGVKKTKSGFSTDASVLNKLADSHSIVGSILEYRELFKLSSTYLESLLKLADAETSRIHSSFNQAITATGRLSSSEPNLQNIPIRTEKGRKIREAFIAENGHVLISADYSQIELRVLAHLSGDSNLQRAFVEGEDIHMATAKEIFGIGLSDEELKDRRRVAKTINFGVIYGISAFRLGKQLSISRKQAQDYIDGYFDRYPGVKKYFLSVESKAEEDGFAQTFSGRRRYLSQIDSSGRDKGYVLRSILNAPLQGSAADIIKIAMINLDSKLAESGLDSRIVLQVHDELVVESPLKHEEEVKKLVLEEMEGAVSLDVPLKVDLKSGARWG